MWASSKLRGLALMGSRGCRWSRRQHGVIGGRKERGEWRWGAQALRERQARVQGCSAGLSGFQHYRSFCSTSKGSLAPAIGPDDFAKDFTAAAPSSTDTLSSSQGLRRLDNVSQGYSPCPFCSTALLNKRHHPHSTTALSQAAVLLSTHTWPPASPCPGEETPNLLAPFPRPRSSFPLLVPTRTCSMSSRTPNGRPPQLARAREGAQRARNTSPLPAAQDNGEAARQRHHHYVLQKAA